MEDLLCAPYRKRHNLRTHCACLISLGTTSPPLSLCLWQGFPITTICLSDHPICERWVKFRQRKYGSVSVCRIYSKK